MTEEVQAPTINVSDVAAMLQIIDAAATRGAFKGEELTAVGSVRDKAAAFVEFIKEQAAAAQAETEAAAETEGAPV